MDKMLLHVLLLIINNHKIVIARVEVLPVAIELEEDEKKKKKILKEERKIKNNILRDGKFNF